ncbi:MAG: CgeB family protein [Myxococcaceae bacterium]
MKFLLPGPFYDDTFAENVAFTLRRMGHVVVHPPPRDPTRVPRFVHALRPFYRELRERLDPSYIVEEERWLIDAAAAHHPDVFLSLTQTMSEETLCELKRVGIAWRIAWWGDPPGNMPRMGLFSREWDAIFLKDRDGVEKFRRADLEAFFLHEACNPAWHRPLATQSHDKALIYGNFYAYRQFLTAKLISDGVPLVLYGAPLPRWCNPAIKTIHSGRIIVKEQKSRAIGEALACINTTHVIEGNSLNCRAFEVAAAGGLQIMEKKPIVEECFDPGKEILLFNSYAELLAHLDRARRYPAEMSRIREQAARRALAEHTYAHRLHHMLRTIGVDASS